MAISTHLLLHGGLSLLQLAEAVVAVLQHAESLLQALLQLANVLAALLQRLAAQRMRTRQFVKLKA